MDQEKKRDWKMQAFDGWFVGQRCTFDFLKGDIIEIDLGHTCPILFRSYTGKDHRFYLNGSLCENLNYKLKPIND